MDAISEGADYFVIGVESICRRSASLRYSIFPNQLSLNGMLAISSVFSNFLRAVGIYSGNQHSIICMYGEKYADYGNRREIT